MKELVFPKNFLWGAATSAFQVEGARASRGSSVWDDFCRIPGKIRDGSNGDVSAAHCDRMEEDVELMRFLGLDAYRFSVSWPRLFPDESGKLNACGADFYDRLIDSLLRVGIRPFLTLYHWDLPSYYQKKGGWLNPEVSEWFYEYARAVGKRYGDRVKDFITLNEPQCFIPYGYRLGIHAPGYVVDDKSLLCAIHNVLRAHGRAVSALRGTSPGCRIGITMAADADWPATDSPEDADAARREILSLKPGRDAWMTNIIHWDDPIYLGDYPAESYERFGDDMPEMTNEDRALISQKLDFHGQNCYSGSPVESDGKGGWRMAKQTDGHAINALGWAVTPKAISSVTEALYSRYHTPIYITENGMCCCDWIHEDGAVHDADRVDFYKKYLAELQKAMERGVDVRGYFAWSLMDNFEWADGYTQRFGLIYVDYPSGKRTVKDSGLFFKDLIARHRVRRSLNG